MAKVSSRESYLSRDMAHMLHGNTIPSDAKLGNIIYIAEGSGVRIKDINGKEYIDANSGGLVTFLGYSNKELIKAASSQMNKLHHYPDFSTRASLPEIDLASKLAELTPTGLNRFTFTNSGSDANETGFKVARFYWRERGKNKYKIISLDTSYHGNTLATLSANGIPMYNSKNFEPFMPGFIKVVTPYCYRCPLKKSYPGCDIACAQALEDVIEKEGEDTVAAFLSEPFVNAAGNLIPPPEYWPMVMEICKKHNVLLIIDEYITGFGRTGKFWGSEHFDIKPDLMMFAKGLASGYMPVAGMAVSDKIYEGMIETNKPFPHVFTYGGHTVSCAVALKTIEIILRDKLVQKAAKTGKYIQERLDAVKKKSPYVGDIRGLGVDFTVELVKNKRTKEPFETKKVVQQVKQPLLEKGVIVGGLGLHMNTVSLVPPLVMEKTDLDFVLDRLEECLLTLKP